MFTKKLYVHIWGGFGSQLFALALGIDIKKKFPTKEIYYKFHTSGVTKREIEIFGESKNDNFTLIKDFSTLPKKRFATMIKSLIVHSKVRLLLTKSKIIYEDNDYFDIRKIKFWTIQTRGHYSNRLITLDTIENVFKTQGIFFDKAEKSEDKITVHFRLGDLLNLQNKDYITVDRIILNLEKIGANSESTIEILTDSIEESKLFFEPFSKRYSFSFYNLPPNETIKCALKAKYFIGTSSKISYWIIAIRDLILLKGNFVPAGHRKNIENFVGFKLELSEDY